MATEITPTKEKDGKTIAAPTAIAVETTVTNQAEPKQRFEYKASTQWYADSGIPYCKRCGEVYLVDLQGAPMCPIADETCQRHFR